MQKGCHVKKPMLKPISYRGWKSWSMCQSVPTSVKLNIVKYPKFIIHTSKALWATGRFIQMQSRKQKIWCRFDRCGMQHTPDTFQLAVWSQPSSLPKLFQTEESSFPLYGKIFFFTSIWNIDKVVRQHSMILKHGQWNFINSVVRTINLWIELEER